MIDDHHDHYHEQDINMEASTTYLGLATHCRDNDGHLWIFDLSLQDDVTDCLITLGASDTVCMNII